MARLTKLERSQKAHSRLFAKYMFTPGNKGHILSRYHDNIWKIQRAKKRVLSKSERREVYNKVNERNMSKRGNKR